MFSRSLQSLSTSPFRKTYPDRDIAMPEFPDEQYRIWGLTAVILHEALIALAPGMYTYRMAYYIKQK